MQASRACFQLPDRRGSVERFSCVFLRLFVVYFLDQVEGSFGICVVKDDTKISIEP